MVIVNIIILIILIICYNANPKNLFVYINITKKIKLTVLIDMDL